MLVLFGQGECISFVPTIFKRRSKMKINDFDTKENLVNQREKREDWGISYNFTSLNNFSNLFFGFYLWGYEVGVSERGGLGRSTPFWVLTRYRYKINENQWFWHQSGLLGMSCRIRTEILSSWLVFIQKRSGTDDSCTCFDQIQVWKWKSMILNQI